MLLISICCTERDFFENSERLRISLGNFKSILNTQAFFLFIIQSKLKEKIDFSNTFISSLDNASFFINQVNYLSVSKARNEGYEYALKNNYKRIIFHDASLIYTFNYVSWLAEQPSNQLVSGDWSFTNLDKDSSSNTEVKNIRFDPFKDTFVWSYVFPVEKEFPRFDERFGPGEFSSFTSGEDFLYLLEYFTLNPCKKYFPRFVGNSILHPLRPNDFSKHLSYAFGQGKIHQIYLLENKNFYALWRCFLFFGNAFFRVLSFKKNSTKILMLRVKGFIDRTVIY